MLGCNLRPIASCTCGCLPTLPSTNPVLPFLPSLLSAAGKRLTRRVHGIRPAFMGLPARLFSKPGLLPHAQRHRRASPRLKTSQDFAKASKSTQDGHLCVSPHHKLGPCSLLLRQVLFVSACLFCIHSWSVPCAEDSFSLAMLFQVHSHPGAVVPVPRAGSIILSRRCSKGARCWN